MASELTERWKNLFRKNCQQWDDANKRRYFNIPNDIEDIDQEELESARDLIQEINGRPAVE